jgi:hypothetical protein
MIPKVVNQIVQHAAASTLEGFNYSTPVSAETQADMLKFYANNPGAGGGTLAAVIVAFVLVLLIIAVVGKFLWNACIAGNAGLLTCVRPATSVWQILGLYVLVALFFGS